MSRSHCPASWPLYAAACLLTLCCAGVYGYPQPSIVQRAWQLDIRHQPPRPIFIHDITGHIRWYWYMIYTVTNNTGADRLFIPEITVATDQGDIILAGQNVPPSVFAAIVEKEKDPLLLSPVQIVGTLRQGEDFAKAGVAIWPVFDHDVDEVSLFFAGLSGETQAMKEPTTGKEVVMRKTLMVTFDTPGADVPPQQQPIKPRADEWIMR